MKPPHVFFPALLLLVLAAPLPAAELTAQPGQPLQAQLERAAAGDTVILPAGTYPGPVTLERPLRLRGQPGAIIDAQGAGDGIRVRAAGAAIEGLTIRNWGANLSAMNAGIFVERQAEAVRIAGNRLHGPGFGIWLDAVSGARVEGNRIQGDTRLRSQDRGNGIHLFNVRHAEILDNEIFQVRDGLYIETSNHNLIAGNRLRDLRYGIHYMYSFDNRVEHNRTRGTRTGYALMQSKRLTVRGNVSEGDENYGFLLNNITHSQFTGNRVTGARRGRNPQGGGEIDGAEGKALFVYNAQFNEFSGNRFADSDIGVHLTAGSEANAIFGNAFVGNYTQVKYVATREQEWSRDGRGNYWSDYLGWDLDGDGIGDAAYQPNDAVDQLLWRHPEAKILMHSPAVQTLRWAQQQFPVFRPPGVKDSAPLMSAPDATTRRPSAAKETS